MSRKPENLSAGMNVRVTPRVRSAFVIKASKVGRVADVHRELLEAYVDGRVTIKRNPAKENLYVD